jgi:hypothetical protein
MPYPNDLIVLVPDGAIALVVDFTSLLFAEQARRIVTGFGGESHGKPRQPKECFESLPAFYGIPRSKALYRELARFESLDGCVVPSFRQLVEALREGFPSESARSAA